MKLFLVSLFTLLSAATAHAQDVPVLAGGEPNLDACPGSGEVVGLDPRGDGFLSVRSGPGGKPFYETDRVYNGASLALCDKRGRWFGVVYGRSSGQDCGLNTPRSVRQAYTGPCRFGWVYSSYVRVLAGGEPTAATAPTSTECEDLWYERNSIYKSAGYCFKTPDAIKAFGNAGCRFDAVEDVPLSENQRRTVANDKRREQSLSCSR